MECEISFPITFNDKQDSDIIQPVRLPRLTITFRNLDFPSKQHSIIEKIPS